MSVVSNQYAAKVFSEHPIAVWPLDDNISFISLISDSQRDLTNLTNWNLTLCSTSSSPTMPSQPSPFSSDEYYEIVGNAASIVSNDTDIILENDDIFSFSQISPDLSNVSINFYLYQDSVYVNYYEFGIRYWDNFSSQYKELVLRQDPINREWINFSHTFEITEFDLDLCDFIFRINVNSGGGGNDYYFIMNGFSIGQWSESSASKTLGSIPSSIPTSTGLTGVTGIAADQYGPLSDNSYHIVEDNILLARNEGIPLIYGSENVVRLYHSQSSNPSFIFPGKGMFAESGKNSIFSLEFWMRIDPNTKTEKRILGPLSSNNGLYVSEGFLTLVINNKFKSHNVSQWYRPMLVHIVYEPEYAIVLVNGEEVIRIDLNEQDINFNTNEWWGFYCYEEFKLFEIDCISIMPYAIPIQVAKRRFVWGQGVESSENIDTSFKGFTAEVSFPQSNYSVNAIYPDKERWDAANYENLVANSTNISVPQYSLPEIFLSGRDADFWYQSNKTVNDLEYPSGNHPKFITFRPNVDTVENEWITQGPDWNEKCYLEFSSSNIFSAPFSAIYGVFEVKDSLSVSRPLIHIVNSLNGKRLEIDIFEYEVSYKFDGAEFYSADTTAEDHVVVGFHIPTLIENLGYDVASFFSSYESLRIYVGGAPDTSFQSFNTFEGKIYKISFSDDNSYSSISSHFTSLGIANYQDDSLFIAHYATYSVSPFYKYNKFFLDVSLSSSWEEYIPLSYFAKYVNDIRGSQYYGFDFLQFNIGYPSLAEIIDDSFEGAAWKDYYSFDKFFNYPIQKNYSILEDENISNYSNYEQLETNIPLTGGRSSTIVFDQTLDGGNSLTTAFDEIYDLGISSSESTIKTQRFFDTSNSSAKMFITFQLLAEGANEPLDSFAYTKELLDTKVIDASLENTVENPYKAYKTKFSIMDGTIIYPPQNIDIEDVAIVIHIQIEQEAILSNPLQIRDMEITSKALNHIGANEIGTKFGKPIYPYTKSGIYYDYKSKNPVQIYKQDTPYLYLTSDSGIRVLEYNVEGKEYAVSVPVNENNQNNFYVAGVQLFIKNDINQIIRSPYPLFEIQYKDETIEFVAESDSSTLRNKITCRNKKTKEVFDNIVFYQNGVRVKSPYLIKHQWNMVAMSFEDPLDFSDFTGSINLFAGCTFNNISYYLSEGLDEIGVIIPKTWLNIWKPDETNIVDWVYWYNESGAVPVKKWKDVYVFAEDKTYSLTPENIFEAYSGTNIDVIDDGDGIVIENSDIAVSTFSDLSWSVYSGKPA